MEGHRFWGHCCRDPRTQQEGSKKRLRARALVLPLLASILCQTNPAMLGLLLIYSQYNPLQNLNRSEISVSPQIVSTPQGRAEGVGSAGIIQRRASCPQGVGRLWLDGCGSLVQLCRQWIPSFMVLQGQKTVNTAKALHKYLWCCSRWQLESAVSQGVSRLPLEPGRGFCHPREQVDCCVLRCSFDLVFPHSEAQRLTPTGDVQPWRGALQWHKETFTFAWPASPPYILNIKLVIRQIQGRGEVSSTYQKT